MTRRRHWQYWQQRNQQPVKVVHSYSFMQRMQSHLWNIYWIDTNLFCWVWIRYISWMNNGHLLDTIKHKRRHRRHPPLMIIFSSHLKQIWYYNKPFSFRTYGRVSKRSLNDDRWQQHIDNKVYWQLRNQQQQPVKVVHSYSFMQRMKISHLWNMYWINTNLFCWV